MSVREKPLIENLFFEKFFLEKDSFPLSKWKKYEDESYSALQKSIAQNAYFILNTINGLKVA